ELVRKCAPVGIAQNQNVAASFLGSTKSAQSVLSVSLKAIKEMFGIVDHLFKPAKQKTDGIRDHRQVFLDRCLQRLGDVKIPRFSEDGRNRRTGIDQCLEIRVRTRSDAGSSRRTKRRHLRLL